MRFDVEINGRARRVEVEGEGSAFTVMVDGRRHVADVTVINGVWSLVLERADLKVGPKQARKVYEVAIVEQPAQPGNLAVHVNGRLVSAVVVSVPTPDAAGKDTKRLDVAPQSGEGGSRKEPAGSHRLIAPMPGRVVRLLAKPGDHVAARQGVIVIEAMKMENELRAARAGTVAEVKVVEGALVEAGAVLVVID